MERNSALSRCASRLAYWLPALLCLPLIAGAPASAQESLPVPVPAPEIRDATVAPLEMQPEDRFVIKFKDAATGSGIGEIKRGLAYGKIARSLGVSVQEVRLANATAVVKASRQLSDEEAQQVAVLLSASPDVEYAEIDVFLRPTTFNPNDLYYPRQWDLFENTGGIRITGAWDRTRGTGQTIAVIDTGIAAHSEFAKRTVPGYDFIADPAMAKDGNGRDNNPRDEGDWCGTGSSSWHGTHVAGTIGAAANNGEGVAGIAPAAMVQPIRALGACGGYMSDAADAVTWAVGGTVTGVPNNPTPARVVNLSLGSSAPCSTTFQNTLTFAASKGAVVVVAAGNDNQPVANTAPANCNNVITVGATGREGARAPYSNYGPGIDVSAPGGTAGNGILSTSNSGTTTPLLEGYSHMIGTSMAAPHVAGVAALMLAVNDGLSPSEVEGILKKTARPLPAGCNTTGCGTGIIDATAALAGLPRTSPEPDPEPPTLSPAAATITGPAVVGATLTAVEGSWAQEPVTFSYQWTRDGAAIPLATNRNYTPTQVDFTAKMAVIITGSKPGYTPASRTSPPVTVRLFIDVAPGYPFAPEIDWIAANGISTGWAEANGTRTYRPTAEVSRSAMAAFLYRLAGRPAYTPPSTSPFTDVATTDGFYKEIAWLAERGISTGWAESDGTKTYRPGLPVSRAAMAAFMYRLAGSPAYVPPSTSPFTDVPADGGFYKEIAWLAARGISTGWAEADGTKTFRPTLTSSREAMAAFMFRYATAAASS